VTSGGLGPTADDVTAEVVAGFRRGPMRARYRRIGGAHRDPARFAARRGSPGRRWTRPPQAGHRARADCALPHRSTGRTAIFGLGPARRRAVGPRPPAGHDEVHRRVRPGSAGRPVVGRSSHHHDLRHLDAQRAQLPGQPGTVQIPKLPVSSSLPVTTRPARTPRAEACPPSRLCRSRALRSPPASVRGARGPARRQHTAPPAPVLTSGVVPQGGRV